MNTKRVMSVKTCEPIDIPENYICCSVCGSWEHPHMFTKREDGVQDRTNCKACYEAPQESWKEIQANKQDTINSLRYQLNLEKLLESKTYMGNSISVEQMIKALKKLPKGSRLFVGQEGYYAEGKFGSIYEPISKKVIEGINYFEIGYSSQNY